MLEDVHLTILRTKTTVPIRKVVALLNCSHGAHKNILLASFVSYIEIHVTYVYIFLRLKRGSLLH